MHLASSSLSLGRAVLLWVAFPESVWAGFPLPSYLAFPLLLSHKSAPIPIPIPALSSHSQPGWIFLLHNWAHGVQGEGQVTTVEKHAGFCPWGLGKPGGNLIAGILGSESGRTLGFVFMISCPLEWMVRDQSSKILACSLPSPLPVS